jgi:hypothetical protein
VEHSTVQVLSLLCAGEIAVVVAGQFNLTIALLIQVVVVGLLYQAVFAPAPGELFAMLLLLGLLLAGSAYLLFPHFHHVQVPLLAAAIISLFSIFAILVWNHASIRSLEELP